jgi:hypothetical protein
MWSEQNGEKEVVWKREAPPPGRRAAAMRIKLETEYFVKGVGGDGGRYKWACKSSSTKGKRGSECGGSEFHFPMSMGNGQSIAWKTPC